MSEFHGKVASLQVEYVDAAENGMPRGIQGFLLMRPHITRAYVLLAIHFLHEYNTVTALS